MNLAFYLFGNLSSGYTQYPDDYTRDIFSKFHKNAKATTQIAIYRDRDVMYYGYVRKLEGSNYIGLCTVVNGCMFSQTDGLFSIYEGVVEMMAKNGYLIHYNERGALVSRVSHLVENREEMDLITSSLRASFGQLESTSRKLSPQSTTESINSVRSFSLEDGSREILRSCESAGYTFIYKSRDYNTAEMDSIESVLKKNYERVTELNQRNKQLEKEVRSLKRKHKNFLWVGLLSLLSVILGFVVWIKVINPSEVTKKDMGEFVYYGPISDGKPNGTGVAIYHNGDKDGRLYYYGNFDMGVRKDDKAILFYKDGTYFKGTMNDDKWKRGSLFVAGDTTIFLGKFDNENNPCDGSWYQYKRVQTLVNGAAVGW